jgi:hypothetical protein
LVLQPETFILPAIRPNIPAVSLDVVAPKLPLVSVAVQPTEGTVTFFHALDVVALVLGSICPFLMPIAVLFVVVPLARVGGAILVEVNSSALCLVIDPLAFVDVSPGLDQSPLSVGHILRPVPFVEGAIFPDLSSSAFAFAVLPLAVVDCSVIELCGGFGLMGVGDSEVELSQFQVGVFDWFWTYFGEFFNREDGF